MELHHVALRTNDLERLEVYYRSILELPVVRRQAGRSVWLGLGSAVLMIETEGEGEPPIPAGSLELLALRVDAQDMERTRARLEEAGVTPEAATEHTLYFRDPDGRRVAVSTYPLPELAAAAPRGD